MKFYRLELAQAYAEDWMSFHHVDPRSRQLETVSRRGLSPGLRRSLKLNLLESIDHFGWSDRKH